MPLTVQQHSKSLAQPPLCEQLKVRDIIDDLFVELNGAFVAGYTVSGINSYYASDEERNRTKLSLEALVRSLPERSMRMQVRFEITEGTGDLVARLQPRAAEPEFSSAGSGPRTDRDMGEKGLRRLLPAPFPPFLFCLGPKNPSSVPRSRVEEEDAEQQL